MKNIHSFLVVFFFTTVGWFLFSSHTEENLIAAYSQGAANSSVDRTGGPFSSGLTCGQCHTGGAGTTTISILVKDANNAVVTQYLPGQSYTVEYQVANPSFTRFGMQSLALRGANLQAGNFTAFLTPNSRISTISTRKYAEQQGASTTGLFKFTWVAPASGSGTVTFYSVGNAVNLNSSTSGDKVSAAGVFTLPEGIPNANINLTAFIQGYYVPGSSPPAMVPARYDNLLAAGSTNAGNPTDVATMTVEFWSNATTMPYTVTAILQSNGQLVFTLPPGAIGNSYWISLRSANALQVWTASSVPITSTTSFNFSNALGLIAADGSTPPLITLAPNLYGLYSGDINQDGFIDGGDYSIFELDVITSGNGSYSLPGDLNGDTFVDGTDYPIFEGNALISAYTQYPSFL
jgi:Reeler domain